MPAKKEKNWSRTPITFLPFIYMALALAWLIISGPIAEAKPAEQDGNLLQNPGFEGNFRAWSSIPEIQVAANWTPWWWENPSHEPAYFRPEYKRAVAALYPNRVLGGDSAQQWFTFHASHLAGMYQQVFNVMPGQRYRFTIWAQVWSSIEDEPNSSILPANPHLQIGIDPTGNWDPGSGEVIWSPEAAMSTVIDHWGQLSVEASAENDVITVFMRTNPEFANKHNDMYWDNASLMAIGPPEPTPAPPTHTAQPVTVTVAPPVIISPTNTPLPIEPSVTPSDTPEPTATTTSLPTETQTQEPTATFTPTPEPPTETATHTPTAIPTETPSASELSALTPTAETTSDAESVEEVSDTGNQNLLRIGVLVMLGLVIVLLVVLVVVLIRQPRAG